MRTFNFNFDPNNPGFNPFFPLPGEHTEQDPRIDKFIFRAAAMLRGNYTEVDVVKFLCRIGATDVEAHNACRAGTVMA